MDATPRQVGRYQILARIPGGGMTRVYLARVAGATGPERRLVLKLLPAELAGDAAAEARFVEEARIALSLSHGNIVSTFEAGHDDEGRPFLVMEYVHGRSLREVLATGGPLPPGLALFVAREVARALRYTHTFVDPEAGPTPIAHLDVSPENVLVSFAGNVKLGDFGIARVMGQASASVGAWGKAPYAAPELARGLSAGPAADVYGLGCVLYELLTGAPPRRGADAAETLRLAAEGAPYEPASARAEVGPQVDGFLSRLLAAEVPERPADAGEVERGLTALLGGEHALLTETDVAGVLAARFPEGERRASEGVRRPSEDGARLRAQLEAAGAKLDGAEDTGRLLALGTVPIGGAETPAGAEVMAHGGSEEPEWAPDWEGARPAGWMILAVAPFVVLIGALAWSGGDSGSRGARTGAVVTEVVPETAANNHVAGDGDAKEAPEDRPPAARGTDAPSGPDNEPNPTPGVPRATSEPVTPTARPTRTNAFRALASSASGSSGANRSSLDSPPRPEQKEQGTRRSLVEEPVRPEPAVLWINAFPYAEIHLDGERVGTTPLREFQVSPGAHVLRLRNPELGLSREVPLELEPGERRTVGIRLDR